jgi:hypothetical protein
VLPVYRWVLFASLALILASPLACRDALEASNRPLETCRRSCEKRASRQCTDAQCERGCEFILDRLIEREGNNVLTCVTSSPRRCTDVVWADCAARIGAHADGGPPGPPPPADDD